jgi:hypothetical protein
LIDISIRLSRKGIQKFVVLPPPLNDSFKMEAPGTTADLLNHTMVQGMARIDDSIWNSSELPRVGGDSREK